MQAFLCILSLAFLWGCRGEDYHFNEKVFHSRDGAVDPSPDAPRLPTPGIGLIEMAALPLKPGGIGAKVFDFVRKDSKDGLRYDYEGVVTLAVTDGAKTVKSTFASSFVELMQKEGRSMSAKVGVEMGEWGGSVGFGYSDQHADSSAVQSNVTWQSESLSQVDNSFFILDGEEGPALAWEFRNFYRQNCLPCFQQAQNITSNMRTTDPDYKRSWRNAMLPCLLKLLATRSHYSKEASLGSGLLKVGGYFCAFLGLWATGSELGETG